MSTMKQIYVSLDHAGKTLPVGVIRFDTDQVFGYFIYLPGYDGPPLDPINLNYRLPVDPQDRRRRGERVFVLDPQVSPGLMHQVFSDAMPGQWGMAVLQAEYPEIRQMREVERLFWMGARTTGALSFFIQAREDERPCRGLDELEVVRAKCMEFMSKLEKMGLGGVRNPAVASHGGVMPKASYEDAQGRHWIAKFDRPGEGIQFTVLEHAASVLAARCGIQVPVTRVIPDTQGGFVFLTERYDRCSDGRHHKASMMTLTGAKEAGQGDYRDMFKVLERVVDPVAWPAQRDELLRRMAFNIGLNVTDDHLRNHELRLEASGSWALTPAYDMVPVSGSAPHQAAIFGQARANINLKDPKSAQLWERIASELGVTKEHVFGLVEQVAKTIEEHWPAMVESIGLNRFNQMFALMAAEVGCGIPFPERSKALTPLDSKTKSELSLLSAVAERAMGILAGQPTTPDELTKLSRGLVKMSVDAARLAHLLRGAGYENSAELVMTAPLSAAANAILEGGRHDSGNWIELEAVSSNLQAVLNGKQQPKAAEDSPRRAAPR
ncbi:type II toxin-antitoxin system HipA family toxin [Paucibacter soli]|uniref:type II toxin-antitoxin system HipA family toxin n=1 Tax=Paucibacter soli TaxID=3133433 RepID=UPI0030B0214D